MSVVANARRGTRASRRGDPDGERQLREAHAEEAAPEDGLHEQRHEVEGADRADGEEQQAEG